MTERDVPSELRDILARVTAKRPKTVIDHILEHGFVTTEELRDLYGYNHPPRGARDVREQGIPLETFRVTGTDGRSIGAYRFGDISSVRATQLSGRTAFSNKLKASLMESFGSRCNIYLQEFPERELQIDHRIPFEIAGSATPTDDISEYMLLCRSANRAKSWSCEHCHNWQVKDPTVCRSCYWAFPEEYEHIAMQDIRRLDIIWTGDEASEYDRISGAASSVNQDLPKFVKEVLRLHFRSGSVGAADF